MGNDGENISWDLSVDEKEEEWKKGEWNGSGRMRIRVANMDVKEEEKDSVRENGWNCDDDHEWIQVELWLLNGIFLIWIVITQRNIFDMFTQRKEEKKIFASSSLPIFSPILSLSLSLYQFSSSFIVVPKGGCLNPGHNNWAKNIVGRERERES